MPDFQSALHLRRMYPAPPEAVFRAWTEPEALQQWFRPAGKKTEVTRLDLRVGGEFRFDLTKPNGEKSYIVGTYLEIERPARLVFTWSSPETQDRDTRVTLEFVERSGATELILRHERFADDDMRDAHQHGWESCIDELANALTRS